MFPGGGYSETMPNDEVDEPFWCDRCGSYHDEGFECDEAEVGCSSCHMIRVGAGGVTYSYAIIGVLCPRCEAEAEADRQDEMAARRAALPDAERIAEEIADRWWDARMYLQNYWPRPGLQPPF